MRRFWAAWTFNGPTRGQVRQAFQTAGSGVQTSEKAVTFFVSRLPAMPAPKFTKASCPEITFRVHHGECLDPKRNAEKTMPPNPEPKNELREMGREILKNLKRRPQRHPSRPGRAAPGTARNRGEMDCRE